MPIIQNLDNIYKNLISTTIKNPNGDIYFLSSVLGEGGYGTVFRGYETSNEEKKLAIKKMIVRKRSNFNIAKNEIDILNRLTNKCENTVTIIDHFHTLEKNVFIIYIVMELIEGFELYKLLSVIKDNQEKNKYIILLFKKVIEAILCIHEHGIIHRDIKPENIMFTNPEEPIVKIIDFGLACQIKDCKNNSGTWSYVPPEIIFELGEITTKSDIYSIGVTFLGFYDSKFTGIIQDRQLKRYYSYMNKYIKKKIPTLNIPDELQIIKNMINPDPLKRPTAQEILTTLNVNQIIN